MRCLKLPFFFDPERLRDDLNRVHPTEWIPHINRKHYDGEWSGAALRSIDGAADNLVPDAPTSSAFRDTQLLVRCRYLQDVLSTFKCPLQSVRLLRLHADSNIAEHVDHALDFEDGEVRIHVPIVTNDKVRFYLDGARLVMAPGECWYTNVNLPHSVENDSFEDRIHLVLDCRVNDWLRELFASTPRPPADHYSAKLTLRTTPELPRLLSALSEYATSRPGRARFVADPRVFVVQWPERHAWQIRLEPQSSEFGWSAAVESSPDPDRRHHADIAAFFATLTREFSTLAVSHAGLR